LAEVEQRFDSIQVALAEGAWIRARGQSLAMDSAVRRLMVVLHECEQQR
jgi:hypothetical protein